jgi:hypothetical protein
MHCREQGQERSDHLSAAPHELEVGVSLALLTPSAALSLRVPSREREAADPD